MSGPAHAHPHDAAHGAPHNLHMLSVRENLIVFAVLMALLVVTVAAAYVVPHRFGIPVALTIATIKAAIVLLYFMHVKFSSRLTQIFAGAAFLWLAILLALTLADYLSRDWMQIDGK